MKVVDSITRELARRKKRRTPYVKAYRAERNRIQAGKGRARARRDEERSLTNRIAGFDLDRGLRLRRRRRGLAYEMLVAVVMLTVVGAFWVIAVPMVNYVIDIIQGAMGIYLDPATIQTIRTFLNLGPLAVMLSLAAYIVLAGMRRNPGEEYA